MRCYLTKLVIVFIALLIIDFLVGKFVDSCFKRIPDSSLYQAKIYHSIFNKKADIIILGGSEASHGYNSFLIENRLHLTTYNAGSDGHDLAYDDIVLQSMCERQTPKIVILDMFYAFMDGSLNQNPHVYCYYGLSDQVTKQAQSDLSCIEIIKLNLNMYRLNSTIPWLFRSLSYPRDEQQGFSKLEGVYIENKYEIHNDFNLDSIELKHLDAIVEFCHKKNIHLYVFISPSFKINPKFNQWLKEYCILNDVHFKDYSFDSRFRNNKLFRDKEHLNYMGAQQYTNLIIKEIK